MSCALSLAPRLPPPLTCSPMEAVRHTNRYPRGLYADAAAQAREEQVSFNELVLRALSEYLERHRDVTLRREVSAASENCRLPST